MSTEFSQIAAGLQLSEEVLLHWHSD
jgi:hypothetical protein